MCVSKTSTKPKETSGYSIRVGKQAFTSLFWPHFEPGITNLAVVLGI